MRAWLIAAALLLGCHDAPVTPDDGELTVAPAAIDLGGVYVGFPAGAKAAIAYSGRASCEVTLTATAPFSVTPAAHLDPASSGNVTVSLTPGAPGALSGTLTVSG